MKLPLAPAWKKEIDGKVYAVKRLGGAVYEVWRDGRRVGAFEFLANTAHGPTARVHDGAEARAVADAFVDACRNELAATSSPAAARARVGAEPNG